MIIHAPPLDSEAKWKSTPISVSLPGLTMNRFEPPVRSSKAMGYAGDDEEA
jgi:hypothetical protein